MAVCPLRKQISLILAFILVFALIVSAFGTVTVNQGVIFKTSSNNAQFTLGDTFEFYKVEVNSTNLWMDKTYSAKHYTRYCIYVTSPNDCQFTLNTWFATANSTAKLTIVSPTSTDIYLGLYSPNLITASASGVVSYSWFSSNNTLLMRANTDTSTVITISATVTETELNITPENFDVSITDMEGCGNWVFSEESYYTFQAQYWDGNGYDDLDTMKLTFSDGVNSIIVVYDQVEDEWSIESGEDVIRLRTGTRTILESNLLQVTFLIYFTNKILDAYDVDIYLWCNDTSGAEDGWDRLGTDYFNIYNLGGHSELTTQGNAGRLPGGDVFDLYAHNGSSAEASITFRNLQHVKLLPIILVTNQEDQIGKFHYSFAVDYCIEDWIEGWNLTLTMYNAYTGSVRYWNWTAKWYNGGQLIKQEAVYFFWECTGIGLIGDNMTFRPWLDFWFNRVNASTTIGVRVNAYYFPMSDASNVWFRWLTGSNWGIDDTKKKQSMMFANLLDVNSNVISSMQIKMVRVKVKIEIDQSSYSQYAHISEFDVFDLTLSPIYQPFEGIQTPVFDETKVPIMPQGGFLGTIVAAFHSIGAWISSAWGPAILGFWNAFVGFLDTIFAWTGYPNLFSNFLSWLSSLGAWLVNAFTWLISALTAFFGLLLTFMGKALNTIASIFGVFASMFQTFFVILNGAYTSGVAIWTDFGLSTWVILIAILYPVYLLYKWESEGLDAVIAHLRMLIDIAAAIVSGFISVIQLFLNLIGRLIESIPVVE